MTRSRLIGLAGAAVAGATLAVVLIVMAVVLAGRGLGTATAAATAGWVVPVAAGVTIAWAVWRLAGAREEADFTAKELHELECRACGGAVFADWRLCPHCGALIDRCTIESI